MWVYAVAWSIADNLEKLVISIKTPVILSSIALIGLFTMASLNGLTASPDYSKMIPSNS
jgi:hypothetical protein